MTTTSPDVNQDFSIDGRFFRRLVSVCRPYWTRPRSWSSWLTIFLLTAFIFLETGFGAKISYLTQEMTDAMLSKQEMSYWKLFVLITLIGLVVNNGIMSHVAGYVTGRLTLHWRSWMTTDLMSRYLGERTYYRIEQDGDVDNVDQRIQEAVDPICNMVITLPATVLFSLSTLGLQGFILQSISPLLFYGVFLYALISTLITWQLYKPFIRLSFNLTVSEADLRYGILHVRTNAETIALYRGETSEAGSVNGRLGRVVGIALKRLRYWLLMQGSLSVVGLVWTILPAVILAPLYFKGQITFGVVTQATASAAMLLGGIQRFTSFLPIFAMAAPHVVRIAQLMEKAKSVAQADTAGKARIERLPGAAIAARALTLRTPGNERTLLRDLNLRVQAREHVLIVGQTGVGKSSLLRAVAGLWREGGGSITMPRPSDVLFLPQRPYMLLGSLRQQIMYPAADSKLTDAELGALLDRVRLPDLAAQHGGFDTVIDWSRVLSLGEQQRIGFARALASGARYVFLDEATSAVDVVTERTLYGALDGAGMTYVSVGHRASLLAYHASVLEITQGGSWRVMSSNQAMQEAERLHVADAL